LHAPTPKSEEVVEALAPENAEEAVDAPMRDCRSAEVGEPVMENGAREQILEEFPLQLASRVIHANALSPAVHS
jgi:hypothetical protein